MACNATGSFLFNAVTGLIVITSAL